MLIVLASDGLWDHVLPAEIQTIQDLTAEEIALECLNTIIEREGTDNTTIIALKI